MYFVGSRSRPGRRKISDFGQFSPGAVAQTPERTRRACQMAAQKSTAPLKRSILAWRRRPKPRVMQCPRQHFVWPECKRFNAAGANFLRAIRALKRGLAAHVSVVRAGLVLQIFPRRQRPRRIAPCGGVVWAGPPPDQLEPFPLWLPLLGTRRRRLSRRHANPRWGRIRPARLRRPRWLGYPVEQFRHSAEP
jgi:hypothetical protein